MPNPHNQSDYEDLAREKLTTQMNDTPNLNAALAKAQADFKAVPFDATNPFLKNRYASLGSCIESTKPILAKYGLSVTQQPTGNGTTIGVITTLRHQSGESCATEIALPLSDEKGKSQAQLAGSIITYLRRYSLAGLLGLYADEDTDGHSTPQTSASTPPKPVQTPAKPISAPKPAAKVKEEPKDQQYRSRFIAKVLSYGIAPKELQEFAVKRGAILPNEVADLDWPFAKMPSNAAEMGELIAGIKAFIAGTDDLPQ